MRVIFNALSAYRQRTGVGSYVVNLSAALARHAGRDALLLHPHGWHSRLAQLAGGYLNLQQNHAPLPAAFGTASHLLPRFRSGLSRLAREATKRVFHHGFRKACGQQRCDLYHEPNFIPVPCDVPAIVTVHDLSVILHPEWHPTERVEFHKRHFPESLHKCRHVLTVSETMRQEIIAHLGVPAEKVTAIPNGVRSDTRLWSADRIAVARKRLHLPDSFLLYVGAIEPRKNVATILRAYCSLPEAVRKRHALVLVGPWGWKFKEVREYYESTARPRGVIHLGYVADDELPALYNAARALLFPSHYEGFGLPPLEMLACGGAVISSTAAALREVLGDCAHFVDAMDESGWRQAMERILLDGPWRNQIRQGGIERARNFTWDHTAECVWQIYRRMK
ncbi:MAG TPA: glycosyltransferase family 1 protein [Gemmataceae bacterium]|jgi:alpha-1,3-rhamnosyl/mannosyltransferase|nr:glycosyltransferase family 1 protein [Gemmataceae bacterium]